METRSLWSTNHALVNKSRFKLFIYSLCEHCSGTCANCVTPLKKDTTYVTQCLTAVAYAENFHGWVSFSGVWCHLYLVCVVCDVIFMFSKRTFWRSLNCSAIADNIKTIVLDEVNYRGTQS